MASVSRRWLRLGVLGVLLVGLLGCASAAANNGAPTAPAGQSGDLASLQQQVAAQGARISALETRVALPQQAAAQPTATPAPTATIVPAVAGLAVDGNTKGSATAKVTITEYLDYL